MLWFRSKKDEKGLCYVNSAVRSLSVLLDLIIIACFIYVIEWLFVRILPVIPGLSPDLIERYAMGLNLMPEEQELINVFFIHRIILEFVKLILVSVFVIYCWAYYGATPAKWILGIAVLDDETLERPTMGKAIRRFFALFVSIAPLFLGFVWSAFDKKGRTWHDKIAGTVVVFKRSMSKNEG